jgi:phage gp37-like protein
MISQIEDAIVTRITKQLGDALGKVAVQKGVEGIPKPAVYVSAESGRFSKTAISKYEHQLALYVDIVFSYRGAGDAERRKGIYLILAGVLQSLTNQALGLKIRPIEPKNWRNSTIEEFQKQGLLVFSLELATAYPLPITGEAEESAADLLAVGMNYYLKPGDDFADAVDLVTLSGE